MEFELDFRVRKGGSRGRRGKGRVRAGEAGVGPGWGRGGAGVGPGWGRVRPGCEGLDLLFFAMSEHGVALRGALQHQRAPTNSPRARAGSVEFPSSLRALEQGAIRR